VSTKYEASHWTRRWRAIHDFMKLGMDPELIADLQAELRNLDNTACGGFYELDEDDLPSHIWYAAVYVDDSVRLQVRNGPSIAFPRVDTMLKYYPMLEWIKRVEG
jgi:hypothetical protein